MNTREKQKSRNETWLIFLCWFVYTVAQLGKYSYSSNITLIMEKFSVSHTQASLPTTLFFIFYGAGQILNGILSKKYNRKYVLTFALLGSAAINISIFFDINFEFVKYLWALNGLLQSTLWVLLMLTVGEKVTKKRMAFAAFLMSTASAGGTFLSYGISALISLIGDFKITFLLAAVLLFIIAVFWFASYNSFKDADPTGVEQTQTAEEPKKDERAQREVPENFLLFIGLFVIFTVIAYAIAGGLKNWMPSILKETFGLGDSISIFLSVFLPFCSIFNAAISTLAYKKIQNITVICTIFFAVSCIVLVPLLLFLSVSWLLTLILIMAVSMALGVITNLLTIQVPLFLQNKKLNSGFLAGLLNGASYLGSAISTYVLGVIADNSAWDSIFLLFIILLGICLFLSLFGSMIEKRSAKK